MWGKKMSTTECGKSMVKCDVSTAQCYNGSSNVSKNKGTTKCDKNIVTCDAGNA